MENNLTFAQERVRRLRKVIAEIEASGTASASLSTGESSRSYTRLDLNTLNRMLKEAIAEATAEYNAMRKVQTIGGMEVMRPHFGRAW